MVWLEIEEARLGAAVGHKLGFSLKKKKKKKKQITQRKIESCFQRLGGNGPWGAVNLVFAWGGFGGLRCVCAHWGLRKTKRNVVSRFSGPEGPVGSIVLPFSAQNNK